MSDTPYMGELTDIVLGQEFLTWLWFKSEAGNGHFTTAKGASFGLYMEQRISVQGGEGESLETATVCGPMSELREARLGLSTGKKVHRALLRLEQDAETWTVSLKAEDFQFNSLKTPMVEKTDGDDDPDGMFLEKIYLVETCVGYIDEIYKQFLTIRLDPAQWQEEVWALGSWLAHKE